MLRTNCRGRTKSLRAIRWLLIQIRDGGGLDESSGGLDGKAWSDSGCILKAEPMVLNYGLDVGYEINRRTRDDANIFAWAIGRMELPLIESLWEVQFPGRGGEPLSVILSFRCLLDIQVQVDVQ